MLTFDEVYATIPGDGWLHEGEARLLYSEAAKCEGAILEVGSFKGRSTCLLASLGRPVLAVDKFRDFSDSEPWEAIRDVFRLNVSRYDNIYLFQMDVADWPTRPVGFAYLDGDHTAEGTKLQIRKALECDPRTIAIHDVADSGGGKIVRDAALELLGPWTTKKGTLAVWKLHT